jgi:hypothetical protein
MSATTFGRDQKERQSAYAHDSGLARPPGRQAVVGCTSPRISRSSCPLRSANYRSNLAGTATNIIQVALWRLTACAATRTQWRTGLQAEPRRHRGCASSREQRRMGIPMRVLLPALVRSGPGSKSGWLGPGRCARRYRTEVTVLASSRFGGPMLVGECRGMSAPGQTGSCV